MHDAGETQSTPKVQMGVVSSLLLSQEYSIIYVEVNNDAAILDYNKAIVFCPTRN
jgi:hypothetical protein